MISTFALWGKKALALYSIFSTLGLLYLSVHRLHPVPALRVLLPPPRGLLLWFRAAGPGDGRQEHLLPREFGTKTGIGNVSLHGTFLLSYDRIWLANLHLLRMPVIYLMELLGG